MLKKLILNLGLLLVSIAGLAQENSASPYSYYGLGEIKFRGTQDARSMGGLAITGDSIALNLMNPASYSRLMLTTFSVGGTSTFNNLKNESQKEKAKRTTLDYLAVGVPMGKFGGAFGLVPYSAVGYRVQSITVDEDDQTRIKRHIGDGSLNRVFAGLSYNFTKNLSFGLNLEYNFGKIESEVRESIEGVQLSTRERNENTVNGLTTNFGVLFDGKLDEKRNFYSSLTYSPEAKLNTTNYRNTATVSYSVGGTEYVSDYEEESLPDSELIVPSKLALGFGIGQTNKWLIGAEVSFLGTKNMVNRFGDNGISKFENGQKYSIGGYYIPNYDSFSSYLSRVVYRAGFRYEKTGLIVNNQSINDYGMNFGLGLPVGVSKIDLGFEIGKRGTTSNGLIQENYFNISVGLSLSDKWFKKTLID
jgi:hypothetical protein